MFNLIIQAGKCTKTVFRLNLTIVVQSLAFAFKSESAHFVSSLSSVHLFQQYHRQSVEVFSAHSFTQPVDQDDGY